MISLIIPLYNREGLIKETVDSIFNQSFNDWEVLIIDDGSTDNSAAIIEKLAQKDQRIKFIKRNRTPKGAPTCRNLGIENAKGEYIIFLDSDDLLKPFSLQQRINTINEHTDLDFWVFQTVRFQDNTQEELKIWAKETEENDQLRFLKLDSVWHTTGPIWRTDSLKEQLKFDEKLACWQDVDFHLQALIKKMRYKIFFHLPADVLYRQHHQDSISQKAFNKEKRESQIYFLQKYYRLLTALEYREIIKELGITLAYKNAESRYFRNLFRLIIWGMKNKFFTIKQVFKILAHIF